MVTAHSVHSNLVKIHSKSLSNSNRTLTFPARKGYNNNNFVINENFVCLINKKEILTMAFDGITIAAMVQELHQNLDGGRFNKIAQPEADALMITGKGANGQCRLLALRQRFPPSDLFYG